MNEACRRRQDEGYGVCSDDVSRETFDIYPHHKTKNISNRGENTMLDIKFVRENPEAVKENIKKKFQDAKLPLVDEVIELDSKRRAAIVEADQLRSNRNTLSK